MKKLLIVLLFSPFLAFTQGNKGFTIEGKLDGYPDATEVKLYKNGESMELATAKVVKEKFIIKGTVADPVLCFLIIGQEKPVEIYVENSTISFKKDKGDGDKVKIDGSAAHKDFSSFIEPFLPLAQQLSTLANTINNTMPGDEREGLMKTYATLQENLQKEIDNFISSKPGSPVAAFILNATYQFNEDPILLESRFNKLTAKVKTSEPGKQLEEFIAESKIGAIGTASLDFTQADTSGIPVSLASFRGKYVLIDFWASWCGPCRQENPNVVESFNKFSKKNFTVLGVSLDRPGQKEKWMEAIHKDGLAWTHVSDLQFWENAAAKLYNVKGIPQNFLVDPEGKIVGRNLRGPALDQKLCELLGCETKGF